VTEGNFVLEAAKFDWEIKKSNGGKWGVFPLPAAD